MKLSRTSKAGLSVVLGVGTLIWLVTMLVFFLVAGTGAHGERFWFALAHLSFLEVLCIAYCAVPFIPAVRQRLVAALYPVFGIVIGIYVLRAVIIGVLTHTVPFLNASSTHLVSALVGLVPFLVLMGILFVLNVWQNEQGDAVRAERADLAVLGSGVTELHQSFLNSRTCLEESSFQAVEPVLKKLKERFQFCTPFNRQPPGAPKIGEEIQREIASLKEKVGRLPVIPIEEKPTAIESIRLAAHQVLQLIDRREKLLVK